MVGLFFLSINVEQIITDVIANSGKIYLRYAVPEKVNIVIPIEIIANNSKL